MIAIMMMAMMMTAMMMMTATYSKTPIDGNPDAFDDVAAHDRRVDGRPDPLVFGVAALLLGRLVL